MLRTYQTVTFQRNNEHRRERARMTHTYQTVTFKRKEKLQKRNMKRCGKFHFGHRGLETSKTSKYVPKKIDFSWEQKVAALGGRKAPRRDSKDAH